MIDASSTILVARSSASVELREKSIIVGKHVYGNLYGCDPRVLADLKYIKRLVREAVVAARMRLVSLKGWRIEGEKGGVSVLALIMESHVAVHTWPSYGYAALDIYTCGEESDPLAAFEHVSRGLRPEHVVRHIADRSSSR